MTAAERARRLALLETEVALDFAGLVDALKSGVKLMIVTEEQIAPNLHPDLLRRIGGMVMLCDHYGASVIFTKRSRYRELNSDIPA